jgi:dynein heavy chain
MCTHIYMYIHTRSHIHAHMHKVREWNICGLPTNELSIQNAVVVTNCERWPLMIDPQVQALRWIRSLQERGGKLRICRTVDANWLRVLELAVTNGHALILEDLGEVLDPVLTPVLEKQVYKQGGKHMVRIGDADVEYDTSFRLYMTTRLPNPHYLPEVCIHTTLVNFTVTQDGLEEQLLGDVVRKERPDLEAQRDKLIVSMAADTKQLQDLQEKTLQLLFESEGALLDNEPLVNTLQQSKHTSIIIQRRYREAVETDAKISIAREEYRVVAKRASLIYFVIADLAVLNPMYQYSLEHFKRMYSHCIEASER